MYLIFGVCNTKTAPKFSPIKTLHCMVSALRMIAVICEKISILLLVVAQVANDKFLRISNKKYLAIFSYSLIAILFKRLLMLST